MNGPTKDVNNASVNLLPLLDTTGPELLTLWRAEMDWMAAVNTKTISVYPPVIPPPTPVKETDLF